MKIPGRLSRKSLFVATKTGHGGRLLRSLNAAELPVERSNPLRTGWCQTQGRVVCIVYCRDASRQRRRYHHEGLFQLIDPNARSRSKLLYSSANDIPFHPITLTIFSHTFLYKIDLFSVLILN